MLAEPASAEEIGKGFAHARVHTLRSLVTREPVPPANAAVQVTRVTSGGQAALQKGESLYLLLELHSVAAESMPLVLRYEVPWADKVEFFEIVPDRAQKPGAHSLGGDAVPGRRNERLALLRLNLPAGEKRSVLVRVTTSIQALAEVHVYSETEHSASVFRELLWQGVVAGIVAMLLFFHGSIYAATRDGTLLRYLAYVAAAGTVLSIRSGLFPQMVLGNYAQFSNSLSVISVSAVFFTGVSFGRAFLELKSLLPRLDGAARFVQYFCLLPALILWFDREAALVIEGSLALLTGPPLIALGIHHFLTHRGSSIYFVIGYSLPVGAGMLENLLSNRVIDTFPGSDGILPAAFVLEFLLFALVVKNKIARITIDKAQSEETLARVRREMQYARRVQQQLLPELHHKLRGATIDAVYEPRKEVGGDYFDIVEPQPGYAGILIADVTGHGLAAALDAAVVRMAFRSSFAGEISPAVVLSRMNTFLSPHLRFRFVSAAYVTLNLATGEGFSCDAGHPPLILARGNGTVEILQGEQSMLGTEDSPAFESRPFVLSPGDLLFLFTDGLVRGTGPRESELQPTTLAERLIAAGQRDMHEKDILGAVLKDARAFRGEAQDDVTAVLLQFDGAAR